MNRVKMNCNKEMFIHPKIALTQHKEILMLKTATILFKGNWKMKLWRQLSRKERPKTV